MLYLFYFYFYFAFRFGRSWAEKAEREKERVSTEITSKRKTFLPPYEFEMVKIEKIKIL